MTAVSPLLRAVEVGLRDTAYAGAAGSLAAGGLVAILSICLTIYGIASFSEGDPSTAPLQTAGGWAKLTGGFGGVSGVIWAHFLLYVLNLP